MTISRVVVRRCSCAYRACFLIAYEWLFGRILGVLFCAPQYLAAEFYDQGNEGAMVIDKSPRVSKHCVDVMVVYARYKFKLYQHICLGAIVQSIVCKNRPSIFKYF